MTNATENQIEQSTQKYQSIKIQCTNPRGDVYTVNLVDSRYPRVEVKQNQQLETTIAFNQPDVVSVLKLFLNYPNQPLSKSAINSNLLNQGKDRGFVGKISTLIAQLRAIIRDNGLGSIMQIVYNHHDSTHEQSYTFIINELNTSQPENLET